MYERCGGCSMCEIGFCNCDKNKCKVMCPNKFGIFHLVNKSVDNKILLENYKFDIESYIPITLDRVQSEFNFNKVNNIIAVHGEVLF